MQVIHDVQCIISNLYTTLQRIEQNRKGFFHENFSYVIPLKYKSLKTSPKSKS